MSTQNITIVVKEMK